MPQMSFIPNNCSVSWDMSLLVRHNLYHFSRTQASVVLPTLLHYIKWSNTLAVLSGAKYSRRALRRLATLSRAKNLNSGL